MRDFAHLKPKRSFGYFVIIKITYSQDTRTDFDGKYAKRRGSTQ